MTARTPCLFGQPDVQRLAISLGVDGHGLYAKLAAGADHAQRDLAPVRYENLFIHGEF